MAFIGIQYQYRRQTSSRLELHSKLTGFKYYSLYDYWQDMVYQSLYTNNDVVVNLATSEYSRLLKPFVTKNQRLIDIVLRMQKNSRILPTLAMNSVHRPARRPSSSSGPTMISKENRKRPPDLLI